MSHRAVEWPAHLPSSTWQESIIVLVSQVVKTLKPTYNNINQLQPLSYHNLDRSSFPLTCVNLQFKSNIWLTGLSDSLDDRMRSPSLPRPLHLVRPAIYKTRVRVCAILGPCLHHLELGNKMARSLSGYAVAIPCDCGQSPRPFALPHSSRTPLARKESQRIRFRLTQEA